MVLFQALFVLLTYVFDSLVFQQSQKSQQYDCAGETRWNITPFRAKALSQYFVSHPRIFGFLFARPNLFLTTLGSFVVPPQTMTAKQCGRQVDASLVCNMCYCKCATCAIAIATRSYSLVHV